VATKGKHKWRWLRFRKGDHAHNLIVAAQRYIHANKGTAVVLGGIGIMHQGEFRYSVVIGATGRPPKFEVKK
jgi:hypothetical protein